MAAGTLPKPGTKLGPCVADCAHLDCNLTRAEAMAVCRFCSKRIGYERRFYLDPESKGQPTSERGLVHAACLEDSIEADRAARVST